VPAANDQLTEMKEAREQADQTAAKQTNYNKPVPELSEGTEVWLDGKNLKLAMVSPAPRIGFGCTRWTGVSSGNRPIV